MEQSATRTLAHYQANAEQFWEGTRDHDVSQNIQALLGALPSTGALDILDLGCGPGRDIKHFHELGHNPVGLDGCAAFVQMAQQYTACPVWHQDLLTLDLPAERFDGVFANAVLFHVPRTHIASVLAQLHQCLRPGGVLFTSNPRGQGQEGWQAGRYGVYYDWQEWRERVEQAQFEAIDHYYRPAGVPHAQQAWLASVWRKI
ncbi:class I SAM-dependent methyltransferase [Alcaligenes endophyticus]|uniref:Class I SAM-dependent methyltransferase n=1 Tax=Alcaligenes endophyticus TaxID=1929088 RepID=A0ABT8ENC7_9BURK|nr:class I SAM-dependent methyltransferase [Alcaligenes endophyticus]MCX5591454.1 class I SAM-dependent methyltransferase [Alcaligenes endophyticus]MDN4122665.1 class I SAM-dependent methyltransferase [Alcaligenes endophyticus]